MFRFDQTGVRSERNNGFGFRPDTLDVSRISVFEFSHSTHSPLEDLWVCEFSTIYGNSRSSGVGIEQAMLVKDKLSRFRDALILSALLLVLPAINSAQEANRLQLSPPALQAGRLIDVESQLGPQPPCGNGPIPPYPGLDDLAIVKSWSKSDLGPDWKPPACTGWAEVGFTTLVTIAARFPSYLGS